MSDISTKRTNEPPATRAGARPTSNGDDRNPGMTDRLRSLSLEKPPAEGSNRQASGTHWGRWLALALVIAGGGAVWYRNFYAAEGPRRFFASTPEVETVSVQSDFSDAVMLDTAGFLVVKAHVDVNAKVLGTIIEFPIEEGMKVKEGDLLARLDDAQYKSEYEAATAGLASAEAKLAEIKAGARPEEIDQLKEAVTTAKNRLDLAKAELSRAEQLGNVISVAELELRKANFRDAEGNVRAAEKRLSLLERGAREETITAVEAEVNRTRALVNKAKYLLDCTRVLAPISGTILQKNGEVGETIRPESAISKALCAIADTSQMEAEVDIPERDIEQVRVGQPCRITVEAYPTHIYEGTFIRRLATVNKNKGTVGARVKVLNPDDKLLPDMNCRVVFLKDESAKQAKDVLRIPQQAVVTMGDKSVVFVIDGENARRRAVELGEKQGDKVEVTKGLVAGEAVILAGKVKLTDGQPVKLKAKSEAKSL